MEKKLIESLGIYLNRYKKEFFKSYIMVFSIIFISILVFILDSKDSIFIITNHFTGLGYMAMSIFIVGVSFRNSYKSFLNENNVKLTYKEYWFGKTLFFILLVIAISIIQFIILILEYNLGSHFGIMSQTNIFAVESNIYLVFLRFMFFHFSTLILIASISNFMSSVFDKTGKNFGFILLLLFLLILVWSVFIIADIAISKVVMFFVLISQANYTIKTSMFILLLSMFTFLLEMVIIKDGLNK